MHIEDQPAPTPSSRPAIWDLVIADMKARDKLGTLVIDWLEKNATARYFAVIDVQEHDYTVEGDST